jgi:tetratricopeptide (TPR) repeat protein
MSDEDISELEELFYEGTDLHGEGRSEEALAVFEKCLGIDPDYKDALLGKAMVLLGQDKFDDAIALAKRIVELDPDDVLAYTNLSMFYQRAGKIPEAEEAGAKARMLDWKRQLESGEAAGPAPSGPVKMPSKPVDPGSGGNGG